MKRVKLIVLASTIFLLAGCGGINYSKLETDFTAKAAKYYETNLKGKVLNVTNHKITLEALEKNKVDITSFTNAKCDKTSYVLIKLTLGKDGKQVGNYATENHLTCGDYTTSTK